MSYTSITAKRSHRYPLMGGDCGCGGGCGCGGHSGMGAEGPDVGKAGVIGIAVLGVTALGLYFGVSQMLKSDIKRLESNRRRRRKRR